MSSILENPYIQNGGWERIVLGLVLFACFIWLRGRIRKIKGELTPTKTTLGVYVGLGTSLFLQKYLIDKYLLQWPYHLPLQIFLLVLTFFVIERLFCRPSAQENHS